MTARCVDGTTPGKDGQAFDEFVGAESWKKIENMLLAFGTAAFSA